MKRWGPKEVRDFIEQGRQDLLRVKASRKRSPDCRNEHCRWLDGFYCPICSPVCPHGVEYASSFACAVCENST